MTKEGQPDPDAAAATEEPPGDPFETGRDIISAAEARHDRWVDIDRKGGNYGDANYPATKNTGDVDAAKAALAEAGAVGGDPSADTPTATVDLMGSDLGVPQEPAPQGTLTVSDGIRERRAVDIDAQCGNSNGGGCTYRASALTQSVSNHDTANLRARNVDLRMYGTMWITTAPFPYKRRRPVDRSVVDAATARAHEYNAHINVARAAVTPLINEFLGRTFTSEREFQAAADQLSGRVSDLFRRTLRQTQDRENNR